MVKIQVKTQPHQSTSLPGNPTRHRQKDVAPALICLLDNTRSRLLSHATQDLGQRTHTVARYNKHHRAPR